MIKLNSTLKIYTLTLKGLCLKSLNSTLRNDKIAVFCDSAFWHGQKYLAGEKFKTNSEFWEHKISRNIERDAKVNSLLTQSGWKVLRFWDYEIKKDLDRCVEQIKLAHETQGNK